jgi:hypothetical protein
MPILVAIIGHFMEDSLGALFVREEANGSSSPSHLPEFPLQHIGGADLLPQFFGQGVIVQAVIKVLLQTPH